MRVHNDDSTAVRSHAVDTTISLCLEHTLGHRAHGRTLIEGLAAQDLTPDITRIEYPERRRLPAPWALRASAVAWRELRRRPPADVTLFHTQSVALFAPQAVRGRPYVVSVDATPVQVDEMGRWYDHSAGSGAAEAVKRRWYQRIFGRAAAVIAWSHWAADSLVADYGVDRKRIHVWHPGAPGEFFDVPRHTSDQLPRILFVGGDFERKGGPELIEAFRALEGRAELTLVTEYDVAPTPGIEIRRDVRPGTDAQREVFANADIFCLPTRGDCTPVALGEAMAAGLPVVTTNIASNPEFVVPEVGALITPQEPAELAAALGRLVDDATLRQQMGRAARARAEALMDSARNAAAIGDLLLASARPTQPAGR